MKKEPLCISDNSYLLGPVSTCSNRLHGYVQSRVSVQCPLSMASENSHELGALLSLLALCPYCSSHHS